MRKCYRSSIIAASWMIVFAFTFDQGLTQTEIALCLSVIDDLHMSVSNFMMEISAASAYTIIFARNIHKVRDFLAIATITS